MKSISIGPEFWYWT